MRSEHGCQQADRRGCRGLQRRGAEGDEGAWYGFPSYLKGKDIVVFYQPAAKFGTRYGTLGFNDAASLDDGDAWPTAYALTTWNAGVEKKVKALVAFLTA